MLLVPYCGWLVGLYSGDIGRCRGFDEDYVVWGDARPWRNVWSGIEIVLLGVCPACVFYSSTLEQTNGRIPLEARGDMYEGSIADRPSG
jgi:hypothetical protein